MSNLQILDRPIPNVQFGDAIPMPLQRVYAARGVVDAAELGLELSGLLPPTDLPDVAPAAERLVKAIQNDELILIVGDFDADGATSVALMVRVLEAFGAQRLSFIVPNRFEFGYGLSPAIVDLAYKERPDLLVTVDNGVASVEGVARANALGMDVVVTDHHLPGAQLPAALAIVNPNLTDSTFGSKNLAGVGVAFYLLSVLRAQLRAVGWFAERTEPNLAEYTDLVALGTVADLVPLDRNNRILVEQGLRRIRAGRGCAGIQALCLVGKRDPAQLVGSDMGFALGPRLNAAGRLDDMALGIRCLLASDVGEARQLASQLDELNRARRELQQSMEAEANLIVAGQSAATAAQGDLASGVCVFEPSWHQGIVGLIAGRLKDRLGRPVIAFAEAGASAPDELKGSARSVPALHIRDLLDQLATAQPGLIERFGGHAMAAGLGIKRIHLAQFSSAFDQAVERALTQDQLRQTIVTDGELAASEISLDLASAIRRGGPWGQAFAEPVYRGEFDLVAQRVVGEKHLKLTLGLDGRLIEAIAFSTPPQDAQRLQIVYRLNENDYGQRVTLQLMVEHIQPLP